MVTLTLNFADVHDLNTIDLAPLKDGRLDLGGPSLGVLIWSLLKRIENLEAEREKPAKPTVEKCTVDNDI